MNSNLPTSFGELLRTLRTQKKIRQQHLADKLGVHRNTIGAWERGDRLPDTRGMVFELARQLCLDESEMGLLKDASFTGSSFHWSVPYQRNPFFSGRTGLFQQMHTLLQQTRSVALTQSLALSGLGGVGKTQAALEYAYRYAHEYTAIVWVTAETHETIVASYRAFATVLTLPEKDDQDQKKIISAVLHWFTSHSGWLLILDNVEDLPMLKTYLPTARESTLFITTRLHSVGILAQSLEMQQMTREEGIRFLLHRANLLRSSESLERISQSRYTTALEITEALDGLPLALDQAGAYIHESGCSLTDFLHLFQTSPGRLLAEREENVHHPLSVTKTFTLAYEKLAQKNPAAVDLLLVCSFLAPDAIPERLFFEGAPQLGPVIYTLISDSWRWNAALKDLLSYSLITCQPETKTLTMHRLVQVVIRDRLSKQTQRQWINRLVGVLNQIFPKESLKMEHWTWCEQLMPHVIKVVSMLEQGNDSVVASSLLYQTATYLHHRASYPEAARYYRQALDLRERVPGVERQQLIDPLIGLVEATYFLDQYSTAITHAKRVIDILEQTQGIASFALIRPLNVLAHVYLNQKQFAEAEQLLLRSLSIWIIAILHNISDVGPSTASIPRQREEEQHAEVLIQQALSLWKQAPDRHHYPVGQALSALSEVYQQQQRYTEAEAILLPLHQLGKLALGERHYMTTFSLMVLAKVYKGQGRLAEAEQWYQYILTLREEALGSHHPKTLETRTEYADLLRAMGKEDEADSIKGSVLHNLT